MCRKRDKQKQKKDSRGEEITPQAEPLVEDPKKQQPKKTGKAMTAVKKGFNNRRKTIKVRKIHFRLSHWWRTQRSSSPQKQARQ